VTILFFFVAAHHQIPVHSKVINVISRGVVAESRSTSDVTGNVLIINQILRESQPGDSVLFPSNTTIYATGGINATGLYNVTLDLQGKLMAHDDLNVWPSDGRNCLHFISFYNSAHLRMTASSDGIIDGQGKKWWNTYILNPKNRPKRPKLVYFHNSTDLLIENLKLLNSPSFHLLLQDVARVEIRFIDIRVDRAASGIIPSKPGSLEFEDLNTDGIDPMGRDIWIHDCTIVNDDDSIAVKPCRMDGGSCFQSNCSENMLIENMVMTGIGASIGSVPPHIGRNCVRNITFRNISMPKTGKGIYIKSNPECGVGKTVSKKQFALRYGLTQ
tara:strand:- start:1026 stop:2012 length:987 start_codon:yes stop_codon:yes gene_type:complete